MLADIKMGAMDLTIRTIEPDEFELWSQVGETPFGEQASEWGMETDRRTLPLDRALAALHGEEMIGTAGAYELTMTVPGGALTAGGVSMVGVLPSHRRRGVLTALMKHQLEDLHDRGEAIAALWASESLIYPRFGYGLASWHGSVDIEKEHARFIGDPGASGRYRMVELAEAGKVVSPIHETVAAERPGMFVRTPAWWEQRSLGDPPERRHGWGPKWCVIWEHEGEARAYATYRVKNRWDDGFPSGRVQVVDAFSTTLEGYREIWRFLFGIDLTTRLEAYFLPLDHPLLFMLDQPDRLRFRLGAGLWVRILDVAAALGARRYPHNGAVTIELADPFCPWNEGTWSVAVRDGAAAAERIEGRGDVVMGATELGMIYLGGNRVAHLAKAGRVHGDEDAIVLADAMFGWPVAPWCPEIF